MKTILMYRSIRLIIMSLFCLITISANAWSLVEFTPSDIGCVEEQLRSKSFYYHNNQVEQLWYGSNKWAVFYDLVDYTTAADTLTLQQIRVYFPYSEGRYNLKVYTDELRPLEELVWEVNNLEVVAGWNRIDLEEQDFVTHERFWVVIEYETSINNRFIAASNIGGANSYFWVPPSEDVPGHFTSMEENNSKTEFLVTVAGALDIEGQDIEVLNFSMGGNIELGGSIYPVFEIRNNSVQHIEGNMAFRLEVSNPTTDPLPFRVANEFVSIEPEQVKTVSFTRSSANIPDQPAQYRIRGEFLYDGDGFPDNNFGETTFDTFDLAFGKNLIENFVRPKSDITAKILDHQNNLADFNGYRLNMFFHRQDQPYYSEYADLRRDFYGLYGYPFTIINGKGSIAGYRVGYDAQLSSIICETTREFGFFSRFSRSSENLELDLSEMRMELSFKLQNQKSYPLESTLNNLRIFVALTEKNVTNLDGHNLLHLHTDPNTLTLGYNEIYPFSYSLSLQPINPIETGRTINRESLENFEVIYWVQDIKSKEIYYIESFGFDEFTLNSEEYSIPGSKLKISVHPNPFNGLTSLSVSLNNNQSHQISVVEIYNIKGQLINRLSGDKSQAIAWDGLDKKGTPAPTGIYLMRINTETKASSDTYYRRISIIRGD